MASTKKSTKTKTSSTKARSTSRSSSSRSMDATMFLKKEHDTVEELMARFKKTTAPKQRMNLSHRICNELTVHALMEERSFYPEMRRVPEVADLVKEGLEEHGKVKQLIAQIEPMEPSNARFDSLMQQLEKDVKHHVTEEEQEMFPKVKKACERDYLMQLTKTLKQTKTAIKKEMKEGLMPGERRVREDVAMEERARR